VAGNLELAIGLTLFGDNFLKGIAEASKKTESFKALLEATGGALSLEESIRKVRKLTSETQKAQTGLEKLKETIKKTFDPKNLDSFGEKLENLTVKVGAVGGAITLGFKSVIEDAAEFEKGLAEASTLVKTDFEKFKKLYSNQLLEISVKLGQEKSEVTKAFYDAISSGFTPQKALEIIKQAGKAAVAGVSDIATANNTLITVMKAWHLPLKDASDFIFKTVAKGRTTFTEIARNIGGVAAIISSAGIKFNEFSAIVAAATAKGLDTAQTMTSIREIVNSLIAPTSQAEKAFQQLGITINKETLKQKGLIGTLKEITDAMKRAGLSEAEQAQMLSQIFGSVEAQKVVNMFIADPETFVNTLKEFQSVGGETEEAFKKMSKSTAFAFNRLSQAVASTKIAFGTLLLPAVNLLASGLTKLAFLIKDFISQHSTLAKMIGIGVGGFGLLLASIAGVAAVTALAAKTFGLFMEGLLLTRKTALGTYNVLYKLMRIEQLMNAISYRGGFFKFVNYELFKLQLRFASLRATAVGAAKEVAAAVKLAAKETASALISIGRNVASTVIPALRSAVVAVRAFSAALLTNPLFLAATAIAAAGFLIYKNWDKVKPVLLSIWKAVKGFFSGIGELIKKASQIGDAILTAFKGFGGGISLLLSKAVNFGKKALVSLVKAAVLYSPFGIMLKEWQKILHFLSSLNLFKAGSKIISTLIDGIKSKAKAIYEAVKGTLSKVRNLLPFSPAKEGPLSDLHKTGLRFVETIAQGIKGDSIFAKVFSILEGVAQRLGSVEFLTQVNFSTPLPQIIQKVKTLIEPPPALSLPEAIHRVKFLPVFAPLPALALGISSPKNSVISSEKRLSSTTTYHIHLNISVNGKADRQTALEIARAVEPVVRKVLREQQKKEARTNYGIGDLYYKA